jgi:hypothetical protein
MAPSPSFLALTASKPDWFDPISILFLLTGVFFVVFGLASHLVRGRLFIPSSVVATVFGEWACVSLSYILL